MKKNAWSRMLLSLVLLVLPLAGAVPPLTADTWRIGTVAPEGSPWTDAVRRLASRWTQASGGQVQLKLYSGGSVGDELDMLRKMRIGQLQGAALTQLGLGRVAPSVLAPSVPFLIHDSEELHAVIDRLAPLFEADLREGGLQPVMWAEAGWVHFFGRAPIVYPQDLKKLKLAVPEGDDRILEAWKGMGFQAVSLGLSDILTGLQTGMVDALYAPPVAVAAFQWFGQATHMSAMAIGPTFGGVVITRRAWEKIPDDLRARLLAEARRTAAELDRSMDDLDRQAKAVMREHGLTIDPVPPAAREEWRRVADEAIQAAADKVVAPRILGLLRGTIADYRKGR